MGAEKVWPRWHASCVECRRRYVVGVGGHLRHHHCQPVNPKPAPPVRDETRSSWWRRLDAMGSAPTYPADLIEIRPRRGGGLQLELVQTTPYEVEIHKLILQLSSADVARIVAASATTTKGD